MTGLEPDKLTLFTHFAAQFSQFVLFWYTRSCNRAQSEVTFCKIKAKKSKMILRKMYPQVNLTNS